MLLVVMVIIVVVVVNSMMVVVNSMMVVVVGSELIDILRMMFDEISIRVEDGLSMIDLGCLMLSWFSSVKSIVVSKSVEIDE